MTPEQEAAAAERRFGDHLRRRGEAEAAITAFRRALDLVPDDARAIRGLCAACRDLGDDEQALLLARRALDIAPDDPWSHVELGNCMAALGRTAEAAAAYRSAMAIDAGLPGVASALARQLAVHGEFDDAARALGLAAAERPKDAELLASVAEMHERRGVPPDAVPWYRRLAALPDQDEANGRLARALLACGRWREGVVSLAEAMPRPTGLDGREWEDGVDPAGRSVFLYGDGLSLPEQMIFLGLLPRLIALGARVALSCDAALVPLVTRAMPGARVVTAAPAPPADLHAPLPLLPLRLAAGDVLAGGVAWLRSGAPGNGKIAFDCRGDGAPAEEAWGPILDRLGDAVVRLDDVAVEDLAALRQRIAQTDVVITANGLTAHLAGTMGKPGLVAVPLACHWMWGWRGGFAPWHPSLRLFRQGRPQGRSDDWRDAMAGITNAVERRCIPQRRGRILAGGRPKGVPDEPHLLDALHRIPAIARMDWGRMTCGRFGRGQHNAVYHLSAAGVDYALRVGKFPIASWEHYVEEKHNVMVAQAARIAPEVVYLDTADGTMLSRLIHGEALRSRQLRTPERLRQAAAVYRRLHECPRFMGTYDIFRHIRPLEESLSPEVAEVVPDLAELRVMVEEVHRILASHGVPPRPSHNDPVAANFVDTGRGLMLIDWQCAGMCDPHWELAALSAQMGLSPEAELPLLAAYFGTSGHPALARITLHKVICHYYWVLQALAKGRDSDARWRGDPETWLKRLRDLVRGESFPAVMDRMRRFRWPG